MVLGYLIATGLEVGTELTFWTIKKLASTAYYLWYGSKEQSEYEELKSEIKELKELIETQKK